MRRGDDRRANPLGAPARDPHFGLRYLMSLPHRRNRRLRTRGRPRLGRRVRQPANRAPHTDLGWCTRHHSGGRRRRSRVVGRPVCSGLRPRIPIPAQYPPRASGFLQVRLIEVSRHRIEVLTRPRAPRHLPRRYDLRYEWITNVGEKVLAARFKALRESSAVTAVPCWDCLVSSVNDLAIKTLPTLRYVAVREASADISP